MQWLSHRSPVAIPANREINREILEFGTRRAKSHRKPKQDQPLACSFPKHRNRERSGPNREFVSNNRECGGLLYRPLSHTPVRPLTTPICSHRRFAWRERLAGQDRTWKRQGEASEAHHEAWKRSDFNQRQFCEARGLPQKGSRIGVKIQSPTGASATQAALPTQRVKSSP